MNTLEQKMVSILKNLKAEHGVVSVRAEFEAEGTRLDELMRLKEIAMTAGVKLTLKIGGCESLRDILEAKSVGVDSLVAPMIESSYALKKYLQAVQKIFLEEERKQLEVLCNIETITACKNLPSILEIPEIVLLNGIVIERVDLCFSKGLDSECINDVAINDIVLNALGAIKKKGMLGIISGGVSADSLPFFLRLPSGYLDRFETRKVCFDASGAFEHNPRAGILKALGFELLWLQNKLGFYHGIPEADRQRIALIEQRYKKDIEPLL